MDIRNCKRCGKMYAYLSGPPICQDCKQQDEEDFQKVKKYIYDNRGASMKDISEACDVSIEKITKFLKEGRLEIKEGSNIILECEKCGQAIKSGRLCAACSKQLERDMSSAANTAASNAEEIKKNSEFKKEGGMRYLKSE